jgi:hypothetical protein
MQQMIFIADLICLLNMFWGHHYAHHQELESIIQVVAACGIWCFGFQVVSMVWRWGLCVRFAGCCSSPQTAIRFALKIICCIQLPFYFHILTMMHGQNHIKKRADQFATAELSFSSEQGDHKMYIWCLYPRATQATITFLVNAHTGNRM